jgi:hypothetical protein
MNNLKRRFFWCWIARRNGHVDRQDDPRMNTTRLWTGKWCKVSDFFAIYAGNVLNIATTVNI